MTLGPAALGLLNIAQRLVQVAQDMTAASIVPVSTVVFARVRARADRLRGSYLKALGVAYAVVSPLMVLDCRPAQRFKAVSRSFMLP